MLSRVQLWAQFEYLGATRAQDWREHALQVPRAKIGRAGQARTRTNAVCFCGAGSKVEACASEAAAIERFFWQRWASLRPEITR